MYTREVVLLNKVCSYGRFAGSNACGLDQSQIWLYEGAVNTATNTDQHSRRLSISLRTPRLGIARRGLNFGVLRNQRLLFFSGPAAAASERKRAGSIQQSGGFREVVSLSYGIETYKKAVGVYV